MVTVDFFALLLILGENIQSLTMKDDATLVFFADVLYQVEEVPFYSYFVEGFY